MGKDLTSSLWHSLMSHCHIHSVLVYDCISEATGWCRWRRVHLHPSVRPSICLSPTCLSSRVQPPHGHVDQAHGKKHVFVWEIWLCWGRQVEDRWMAFTSLPAGMTSPSRQLEWIEHDVIASKSSCEGGDCLDQVFAMQSSIEYLGKQSHFTSIRILLIILVSYISQVCSWHIRCDQPSLNRTPEFQHIWSSNPN